MDRELRPPLAFKVVTGVALILFSGVAIVLYQLQGWTFITVGAMFLLVFAVAGFIDAMTARVELNNESIVIVQNLIRREYPRSMFVKVTWGKGMPVALQSKSGEWVRLPGVGKSSQAVVNTLRAWLNG